MIQPGTLTFPEFALAMYLIDRKLTNPLEPVLIPPPNILAQLKQVNEPKLEEKVLPDYHWIIGREEKNKYDLMFNDWDKLNEGYIPGEKAREIFSQSGTSI